MTTVAVAIPVHPPRLQDGLLTRAIESVLAQTRPVDEIHVAVDRNREGAARTRTRACKAAQTDYLALLDSDDILYPKFIERMLEYAEETGADLIWPWFDVLGGRDPFPQFEGRQWDAEEPHQFPITVLVKRAALEEVGWFEIGVEDERRWPGWTGEDFLCWTRLSHAGRELIHLEERLWGWSHHESNTMGRPDRW